MAWTYFFGFARFSLILIFKKLINEQKSMIEINEKKA